MIDSYGPIIRAARALSVSPKRRRPSRGPVKHRPDPHRWSQTLRQSVRRRFLRSLAFGTGALGVAVATPLIALLLATSPSTTTDVMIWKIDGSSESIYLDAIDNGGVGFGPALAGSERLSDSGPEVSRLAPSEGTPPQTLATRAPSLPGFSQSIGNGPVASSTPTPLATVVAAAPAAPIAPESTAAPVPVALPAVQISNVSLTFYSCLGEGFCGNMSNGERVYEGAVACSYDLPIGTQLRIFGDPTGRVYVCKDRGLLSNTWIDVFFHDPADGWAWQAAVGRVGTIEIVSVP